MTLLSVVYVCVARQGALPAALKMLKEAASAAPTAPRVLAECGWIMFRAAAETSAADDVSNPDFDRRAAIAAAAGRARRLLERAVVLCCGGSESGVDVLVSRAPPDIAARLGVCRWRERTHASAAGVIFPPQPLRGPGSAHAALLAAAAAAPVHLGGGEKTSGGTIKADTHDWRAVSFAYLAEVCDASGETERGRKCRHTCLVLSPADPVAGPAAVHAAMENGDTSHAAAVCEAALAEEPRCVWAAARLAPLFFAGGRRADAARCMLVVLNAHPTRADVWVALGASYASLGKHAAAVKSYERAVDVVKHRGDGGGGDGGGGDGVLVAFASMQVR